MGPTVIKCKQSPQVEGEPFSLVKRHGKTRPDGYMGGVLESFQATKAPQGDVAWGLAISGLIGRNLALALVHSPRKDLRKLIDGQRLAA